MTSSGRTERRRASSNNWRAPLLGATIGWLSATDCVDEDSPDEPEPERASFAHDLGTASGAAESVIVPWPIAQIPYAFEGFHPELDEAMFRAEVRSAFDEWTRATEGRRTFHEVSDAKTAQLVIGFRAATHEGSGQCEDSFSRGLRTIAHVFTYDSVCLAGIIHLNQDLTWVMDGSNRNGTYDVRYAILHEVGHALGLDHVASPGHIMYPEYVGVVRKLTDQESQDVIRVLEEAEK